MHQIDGPGATVDHKFTDGDPVGGVQATVVTEDWLNDVQENIMAVLAAGGITPTKGRSLDLSDAILAIVVSLFPKRVFTANSYIRIPDVPGGLIIQWGTATGSASAAAVAPFSVSFSVACRQVALGANAFGNPRYATWFGATLTGFSFEVWNPASVRTADPISYIAVGY